MAGTGSSFMDVCRPGAGGEELLATRASIAVPLGSGTTRVSGNHHYSGVWTCFPGGSLGVACVLALGQDERRDPARASEQGKEISDHDSDGCGGTYTHRDVHVVHTYSTYVLTDPSRGAEAE